MVIALSRSAPAMLNDHTSAGKKDQMFLLATKLFRSPGAIASRSPFYGVLSYLLSILQAMEYTTKTMIESLTVVQTEDEIGSMYDS